MPYIIFISPPSFERLKMNRQKTGQPPIKDDELKSIIQEARQAELVFGHYFDKVIVNYDLERTFQELRLSIHRLETEPQFVPLSWLLDSPNDSNTITSHRLIS
jgi:MAGUK p55 subfamily protein 5